MLFVSLGNHEHLYMWDTLSLANILQEAGCKSLRPYRFNDYPEEMFKLVEESLRFENAVALETIK